MRALLCCILVLWPLLTLAQQADLDSLLKPLIKPGAPGGVVLVTKGGETLYRKAFGMANLEHQVPIKPESVFEIGSITKQFTAVSILMLVEQGKISVSDPLMKFLPDFPGGEAITIHHLLNHTSGIRDYTSIEKLFPLYRNEYKPVEWIGLWKNEPLDFQPGDNWRYSNSGYFLLGYIIEKVSGVAYGDFLQRNIIDVLNLKNTFFGSQSAIIPNRADGYQYMDKYLNAEYLSFTVPYSAGGIVMSVDDLFEWNKAIHTNRLLKEETIQMAFTDYKRSDGRYTHYGYGWALSEVTGSAALEHGGGIYGFITQMLYLPAQDVFVALFTNCDCNDLRDTVTKMAAVAIGKPFPAAVSRIKLDDNYGKSLAGVYDFEDGSSRYIIYENGSLYSQRPGSSLFPLFAQSKELFVFGSGITQLSFRVDKKKATTAIFKNRLNVVKGVKTERSLPR